MLNIDSEPYRIVLNDKKDEICKEPEFIARPFYIRSSTDVFIQEIKNKTIKYKFLGRSSKNQYINCMTGKILGKYN